MMTLIQQHLAEECRRCIQRSCLHRFPSPPECPHVPVLTVAPVRELPNINERINYPNCGADCDGSQLGVISREEALDVAKERELDLVLVSEKADPPVPIMITASSNSSRRKRPRGQEEVAPDRSQEVKMRYKIDQHDYDVRIGQPSASSRPATR